MVRQYGTFIDQFLALQDKGHQIATGRRLFAYSQNTSPYCGQSCRVAGSKSCSARPSRRMDLGTHSSNKSTGSPDIQTTRPFLLNRGNTTNITGPHGVTLIGGSFLFAPRPLPRCVDSAPPAVPWCGHRAVCAAHCPSHASPGDRFTPNERTNSAQMA